jgi:5-methylcytosine-specific restriction endonuclease McrA
VGRRTAAPFSLVAEATPPAAPPPQQQLVHQLRCTINDETKAKLLRLAEVLGIVDPLNKLDQLITKATEIALQAKDPALRSHERKSNASEPKPPQPGMQEISSITAPEAAEATPSAPSPAPTPRRRTIPVLLKRQVLRRAEFQCEYASADGRRCTQKTGLEIDHRFPFSWGGEHSAQNLAVLCHSHHRRKTDEQQGPWVGRKKA